MTTTMASLVQYLCYVALLCSLASSAEWPVPYRRFPSRPPTNPYCQAGVVPFCPTGRETNTMPEFNPSDVVEVYAMKAPVWEFKFGDMLAKLNIMHDAIGFKNVNTGYNYTMEFYELFQLFNCTFPHLLSNNTLKWCNQGANCIYDGIDDKHWAENGTLVKVAVITGQMFNDFGKWVEWDNNTGIYYESWTVYDKPGGNMWFDSYECASFVQRIYQKLGDLGAAFNHSISLNYTRANLYCDEPQFLGNASTVFAPGANQTLAKDIIKFYSHFQAHKGIGHLVENLLLAYAEVYYTHRFYLFYNFEYWYLPMTYPFLKITYLHIPFPGAPGYVRIPDQYDLP